MMNTNNTKVSPFYGTARRDQFMQQPLTCVEICAGAGGQALGLAMAGFVHVAFVEYEADYCKVLKENRPE